MNQPTRRKIGARPYAAYTKYNLSAALQDVKSGLLTVRKAAEKYKVSKSTISRKLHGKNMSTIGHPRTFSEVEEAIIQKTLLAAAKWGFPLSAFDVRCIIKAHLDKKGIQVKAFKNNFPGRYWVKIFLDRNKSELSCRLAENIKRAGAQVDRSTMQDYFDHLEKELDGIPPEAIINFDETNLVDDPGKKSISSRR